MGIYFYLWEFIFTYGNLFLNIKFTTSRPIKLHPIKYSSELQVPPHCTSRGIGAHAHGLLSSRERTCCAVTCDYGAICCQQGGADGEAAVGAVRHVPGLQTLGYELFDFI